MKQLALIILVMGLAVAGEAQVQPVRLNVNKSTKRDLKTTSHSSYSRTREGTESVSYTIEVINRTSGALNDLTIRWTVLTRPTTSGSVTPQEGEKKINLGVGQRTVFDTDPINLAVSRYDSSYGYRYNSGDRLEGYLVEVLQGLNVVASDSQPPDMKHRIEALKAKSKKQ